MRTQRYSLPARVIALVMAFAIITTACGSSSVAETAAEPTSTPAPPAANAAATEAWATTVSDAWAQLNDERFNLFWDDFNLEVASDDTIAPWVTLIRGEADSYERFATTLDQAPDGSGVEEATAAFFTEIGSGVTALRGFADDLDAAFEGILTDDADLNAVDERRTSLLSDLTLACFPFQDAVASANLPLINCALSDPPPPPPEVGLEGGIILPAGHQGELEPGMYQLPEFARPFAIELPGPSSIQLFSYDLELRPLGDWEYSEYFAFWIVAPDELPVPGTPYGPITETVPFSDDLGSWFLDSGLEIVAEGTTELAEGSAPYWTLAVPGWSIETSGAPLAFADFDGSPGVYPIRHNSTVWQIPHPLGPLVVIAQEKWEIPGAPGIEELTEHTAAIIATIVAIEGPGAPPPTPTPTPSEPDEPATTEPEVAMLREAVLNLEGRERWTAAPNLASVFCDDPQIESLIPLATGQPDAFIDMYSPDRGSAELLEFGSEADRDAHFTAVLNFQSVCETALDETYIPERIEVDPGYLLIYSVRGPDNSGGHFPPFYFHVTAVGSTGLLTVRAESIDAVEAVLVELGMG